jgi:hypothetical protein
MTSVFGEWKGLQQQTAKADPYGMQTKRHAMASAALGSER